MKTIKQKIIERRSVKQKNKNTSQQFAVFS
jgi:hypothetical protein